MLATKQETRRFSSGDGAAAALNILWDVTGEHDHDFDVPADADAVFGGMSEDARESK